MQKPALKTSFDPTRPDPTRSCKILVMKLRAMGDTILTTSVLQALRRQWPEAELHALVPTVWAPLLEHDQSLNFLLRWPRAKGLFKGLVTLRAAWQLRRQKYDMVVALHASNTAAWLARLSGAKERAVHFHGLEDENRFSTVEIAGKGQVQPILERDLDTVRALGVVCETPPAPRIDLTEDQGLWAQRYLEEKKLTGPLLALGLGASRPAKCWPLTSYLQLAEDWVHERHGSVVVLVGPGEEPLAANFHRREGICVAAGQSLLEMAALLKAADLFVGNDSGPKHLAAALGTRTITLFGPENPLEWHPYDQKWHPRLFREGLSCRKASAPGQPEWCGVKTCTQQGHRCMREIEVSEVKELWQP